MATPWGDFPADLETLSIRESSNPDNFASRCVVTPIVTSSNFMLKDASVSLHTTDDSDTDFMYGRLGNPTRNHLEQYFAKLDNAKYALAFGSGVAALGSVVLSLQQNDHVVASKALYGGSVTLLQEAKKYGILTDFFNSTNDDDIMKLVKPNTKMVYLESPSNPDLRLLDIETISRKVHERNPDIIIVVDNTFLTPVLQQCLTLGADVCIYSSSKYIGGHADIIGGLVTMNNETLYKKVKRSQEVWGGIPSPFDCYLAIRSLKTLHLRMEKHARNSLKVAKYLETDPHIDKVLHPGLRSHPQHALALKQQKGHSGMIGFHVKGGLAEACKVMDNIKLIRSAPSLGSDISLMSIPAKMSHSGLSKKEREEIGVPDNFVRLSVGLERAEDIIEDLKQALRIAFSS